MNAFDSKFYVFHRLTAVKQLCPEEFTWWMGMASTMSTWLGVNIRLFNPPIPITLKEQTEDIRSCQHSTSPTNKGK